jgi:hypothetical protein
MLIAGIISKILLLTDMALDGLVYLLRLANQLKLEILLTKMIELR